jgi:uncharacterized membrane protein
MSWPVGLLLAAAATDVWALLTGDPAISILVYWLMAAGIACMAVAVAVMLTVWARASTACSEGSYSMGGLN